MCKYSDETIQEIAKDYTSGAKLKEIEQKYNIPHGSVHSVLRIAGVQLRNRRNAPQKKCPNCGRESKEQTARFCCWCGTPILTEKEKIIETAEHLFPMVAFCPETRRDGVQQAIKDIIAYIKENCKG